LFRIFFFFSPPLLVVVFLDFHDLYTPTPSYGLLSIQPVFCPPGVTFKAFCAGWYLLPFFSLFSFGTAVVLAGCSSEPSRCPRWYYLKRGPCNLVLTDFSFAAGEIAPSTRFFFGQCPPGLSHASLLPGTLYGVTLSLGSFRFLHSLLGLLIFRFYFAHPPL